MINIAFLTKEHISAAAVLEKACLDTAWSEKSIADFLLSDTAVYLCAFEEGTLCGILSAVNGAGECEIENIAVAEAYRRRGVGKALINALKPMCENIFLLVKETNEGAVSFYTALGFSAVGVRKGYYKGTNALIMQMKGEKL